MINRLILLVIALHCIVCSGLYAQPGMLDTTFNHTGIVIQDIAGRNDYGFATAVQPDGKILTAGFGFIDTVRYNDFVLMRYKPNGELDSAFGINGITNINFYTGGNEQAMSVCLQPDGRIIVAGRANAPGSALDFAIARYNADGSLDPSFGTGGLVTTDIAGYNDYGSCVKLQSDGKIVMAGYTNNGTTTGLAVIRYNTNGSLDNTFSSDGIAVIQRGDIYLDGQSLAIQSDGRIVAMATTKLPVNEYDILLACLKPNGTPDSTFNDDGIVTTDFCYTDKAYSVALQSDGKIVVAGASYDTVNIAMGKNVMLIRYRTDGSIDSSFGRNGKVITEVTTQADGAYAVAIQSNGKILTVGHSADGVSVFQIILTRHMPNGNLDSTFGVNGTVATDMASMHEFGEAIALQSDGKIVVTGFVNNGADFNMFTARYIGDVPTVGIVDALTLPDFTAYPNPCTGTLFIQSAIGLGDAIITLVNIQGQTVKEVKNLHGTTYSLACNDLSSGLYLLHLSRYGLTSTKKLVIISGN